MLLMQAQAEGQPGAPQMARPPPVAAAAAAGRDPVRQAYAIQHLRARNVRQRAQARPARQQQQQPPPQGLQPIQPGVGVDIGALQRGGLQGLPILQQRLGLRQDMQANQILQLQQLGAQHQWLQQLQRAPQAVPALAAANNNNVNNINNHLGGLLNVNVYRDLPVVGNANANANANGNGGGLWDQALWNHAFPPGPGPAPVPALAPARVPIPAFAPGLGAAHAHAWGAYAQNALAPMQVHGHGVPAAPNPVAGNVPQAAMHYLQGWGV